MRGLRKDARHNDLRPRPTIPGGVLTEKLGGGVRHASCNPYPISDQNLWFFLPYFRPDEKFETLFQTWSPVAEPGPWQAVTARTR